MELIITAGISAFVAGAFSLVTLLLQRKWSKNDKGDATIEAIKEAQKVMMLDRIRHVGQAYIRKGEVDFDDHRLLHQMHTSYKGLGGNGDLDKLMKDVDKLAFKD